MACKARLGKAGLPPDAMHSSCKLVRPGPFQNTQNLPAACVTLASTTALCQHPIPAFNKPSVHTHAFSNDTTSADGVHCRPFVPLEHPTSITPSQDNPCTEAQCH